MDKELAAVHARVDVLQERLNELLVVNLETMSDAELKHTMTNLELLIFDLCEEKMRLQQRRDLRLQ